MSKRRERNAILTQLNDGETFDDDGSERKDIARVSTSVGGWTPRGHGTRLSLEMVFYEPFLQVSLDILVISLSETLDHSGLREREDTEVFSGDKSSVIESRFCFFVGIWVSKRVYLCLTFG